MIDQALGESSYVRYRSLDAADRRPRPVQSAGWLARSCDTSESFAGCRRSAGGGNHPAQHSARAAIGARAGPRRHAGSLIPWPCDAPARTRCGDCLSCRPTRHRCGCSPTRRPRCWPACCTCSTDWRCSSMLPANLLPGHRRLPAKRTRLATCSRQCGTRVCHDRCGRAFLGRHRLAERRIGDRVRGDRGSVAFAERRSGLRRFDRVRARHRRRCHLRGAYQIRGAASASNVPGLLRSPSVFTSYRSALAWPLSRQPGSVRRVHRHGRSTSCLSSRPRTR